MTDIISATNCQSETEFIVDALFLGVTLETKKVTDSITTFKIDGEQYEPPRLQTGFSRDIVEVVELDARDHDLAKIYALSEHAVSLGLYMARCTALVSDMYDFGLHDASVITQGSNGFQVTSLAPFEWDDLPKQN